MGVLDNLEGGGVHVVPSLIHMDLPIPFGRCDNSIAHLELGLATISVV